MISSTVSTSITLPSSLSVCHTSGNGTGIRCRIGTPKQSQYSKQGLFKADGSGSVGCSPLGGHVKNKRKTFNLI